MNKLILPLLTVSLISGTALAASFAERCPDIAPCAKAVSELTGQKYVFDMDVKGSNLATPNIELTKENGELLLTELLYNAGYARVATGEPGTWRIMRQRDARDSVLPIVEASKDQPPQMPNTWDLVTMKYRAAHPLLVEDMARTARSFMPANSRIIPVESPGLLLVTDTAPNARKLYEIVRAMDVKPTPEFLKRRAEERSRVQQTARHEKTEKRKKD
jgi:hypothetical protein